MRRKNWFNYMDLRLVLRYDSERKKCLSYGERLKLHRAIHVFLNEETPTLSEELDEKAYNVLLEAHSLKKKLEVETINEQWHEIIINL
ncbi:hypothetical protein [Ornithobacterium rhinotracheale]|uniref:hypothetical protein n=1 Tax=Ornithobacterium rhinotracheale TaxID=28251 RepID=UPI00129C8C6C|nr:hypothetical protein [Ornithobacterium rhinotracheale]MRJ09389.1 hypothetical protein [Ornithobacterium rhinotracheale]UOH78736.1 hypothetical protein MT996_04505 [Ornithobacterium rhinotracheale]